MARRDIEGAVDFSVLEHMAADDAAVIEEVLALFVEQAAIWSAMLDVASPGWRDAAHTLKGAAAGIGAGALAQACSDAEVAQTGVAEPALTRVRDALGRALTDVAAYRHECALLAVRGRRPFA